MQFSPDSVFLLAVVVGELSVLADAGGAVGAEQEAVEVQRGDVPVQARLATRRVHQLPNERLEEVFKIFKCTLSINKLSINHLEEVAVGEVVVLLLPGRLGDLEVECVEVREEGGVLLRRRVGGLCPRLALGEEVAPLLDPLQLPRTVTVPVMGLY